MMQDTTRRKRYIRQASAIAASGRITKPFSDVIPTHGAVALHANGGYSSTRVEGCRYKEILSFGSAYSEVAGSDHGPDGPFDTVVMTVIEGLKILNVVTCDRVVARISSTFPTKDKDGNTINEPEFTTIGSRFEGLRIGKHYFAQLDLGVGAVCDCGNWTSMQKGFQGDNRNALMKAAMFAPEGNAMPRMLGFSLAPSLETSPNVTEILGQIYIPQVGTVYLGELFVTQYSRQLVMLRVAMGCPVAGDTTVADVSMVGDSFPP